MGEMDGMENDYGMDGWNEWNWVMDGMENDDNEVTDGWDG